MTEEVENGRERERGGKRLYFAVALEGRERGQHY